MAVHPGVQMKLVMPGTYSRALGTVQASPITYLQAARLDPSCPSVPKLLRISLKGTLRQNATQILPDSWFYSRLTRQTHVYVIPAGRSVGLPSTVTMRLWKD